MKRRLKEVAKVKLGDVARESRETIKTGRGLPFVGLEHLVPEQIKLTQWDAGKENTFTKAFHKGQILFGRRRAYLKKAAFAPIDGICSGDITVIEAIPDKLLPDLMPFVIQNDRFFDFAMEKSAGSLSPRVKWEQLSQFEFNLPPLNKQKELSKLFWAADAAKEAYKTLLFRTDELVKSRFIEMFGDIDVNEKGWERGKIRDIVTEVKYGTSRPAVDEGQYPYLRMNNITFDGQLDLSDLKHIDIPKNEVEKCLVRKGDILFNRTNSQELVGKTCIFNLDEPMIIAGYIIRVRLNEKAIPVYLSTVLNSDYGKSTLKSMCKKIIGQANINAQEFQNIEILIPPLALQEQFAAFVEQADKSKFELQKTLDNLETTYKSLIKENLG
jgi:type I restriction enzyme S subunit